MICKKINLRVLFVIDGLYSGGKERQLVEIIRAFKTNHNVKVGVITFNKNLHYSLFVKSNVSFFHELNKRPTRLEPFITIWRQIKLFKPDIIHTWDGLSSLYSILPAKLFNIKVVNGSIRDAGIEKSWRRILKIVSLKLADHVIANSQAGLTAYKAKGSIIYNAIDMNRFLVNNGDVAEFNIVMAASFSDYKDHSTFFDAAIKLVNANIVENVFLLGDGPNRNKYQVMITEKYSEIKNSFFFAGTVDNVEEYLTKCKVGVLCSTKKYSEGLSNSVLEYMAAGLVPIVTKIGGNKEIVNHNQNGFLVDPEDSEAICTIITELRHNHQKLSNISYNAENTVTNKFDFSTNIQKLLDIYRSILGHEETN